MEGAIESFLQAHRTRIRVHGGETIKITVDFLVGQPHHPRNQCLSRSRVCDLAPTPKNVCGKHRLTQGTSFSSLSNMGIISGQGSFAVQFGDHLLSGIICGPAIICGAVQKAKFNQLVVLLFAAQVTAKIMNILLRLKLSSKIS